MTRRVILIGLLALLLASCGQRAATPKPMVHPTPMGSASATAAPAKEEIQFQSGDTTFAVM